MANNRKRRPKKPNPSCPLAAHPNGQWCKKIRGKVHFFGVWADAQTALERHHAVTANLHAGRAPRFSSVSGQGLTVKVVCNGVLSRQKEKLDGGEIRAC